MARIAPPNVMEDLIALVDVVATTKQMIITNPTPDRGVALAVRVTLENGDSDKLTSNNVPSKTS